MAVKNLTLNEMVQISDTLTDPGSDAHQRLAAVSMLAGLLPLLEQAHRGVLKVMPTPENPRLKELSAQAAAQDAVHDALVASTYELLTSTSRLVSDGAPYIELRDQLLPDGVAGASQITYEGEAGYVKRLRANLTEAQRARLASIPIGDRSLLDVVTEWMDAGDRIGQLDQERQRLAQASEEPSATTMSEARFQWIRVVNALRGVALVADLSDKDRSTIFGSLDEIEIAADQRAARRRASNIEQDVATEGNASA